MFGVYEYVAKKADLKEVSMRCMIENIQFYVEKAYAGAVDHNEVYVTIIALPDTEEDAALLEKIWGFKKTM